MKFLFLLTSTSDQSLSGLSRLRQQKKPLHCIYDTACDSLMYVLPGKWPVMNECKAREHGLSMTATVQRTASNIDFDFEPTEIQVDERYAVAVNYHYVRPDESNAPSVANFVTPASFGEQLRQLSENHTFCRCQDLVDEEVELSESNIVISFDDGSKDIATTASSVLARYHVSATFFVCSRPYLENQVLDVHKIQLLMQHLGVNKFSRQFYELLKQKAPSDIKYDSIEYAGDYQFYRYDNPDIRDFKLDLNYRVPQEYTESIVNEIFYNAFGDDVEPDLLKQLYLSQDDLKRLMDDGHELGIHGHSHRVLPRMDFDQQKTDLKTSAEFLQSITGNNSFSVALPYGFSDTHTKRAMKELGMKAGFSMGRGMITPEHIKQRWSLPRYDVNDCFDKQTNDIRYDVFSSLSTGD